MVYAQYLIWKAIGNCTCGLGDKWLFLDIVLACRNRHCLKSDACLVHLEYHSGSAPSFSRAVGHSNFKLTRKGTMNTGRLEANSLNHKVNILIGGCHRYEYENAEK